MGLFIYLAGCLTVVAIWVASHNRAKLLPYVENEVKAGADKAVAAAENEIKAKV